MVDLEGLPKEEVEQWLHNPITKLYRRYLEERRLGLLSSYSTCGNWDSYNEHLGREKEITQVIGELT